jgi:hypothetical protein
MRLAGGEGASELVALRLEAAADPWLSRERNVFLAFDATGDFGPGGRAAAHEVLERLIGSLPPGCTTALIAFDGKVKFDPDKLMLHLPARAESMLDRLWQLESGPDKAGPASRFLAGALVPVTGLEGEGILVLVTGRTDPGDLTTCRELLASRSTRLAVLQVGADRPAPAWRALCADTGGVALPIPPTVSPELGVLDFLANLPHATVSGVECLPELGEGEGILAGPGGFANQPVIALLEGGRPARRLAVATGDEKLVLSVPREEQGARLLSEDEARALLALIRGMLIR